MIKFWIYNRFYLSALSFNRISEPLKIIPLNGLVGIAVQQQHWRFGAVDKRRHLDLRIVRRWAENCLQVCRFWRKIVRAGKAGKPLYAT